jgi:outer membrane protein TolC
MNHQIESDRQTAAATVCLTSETRYHTLSPAMKTLRIVLSLFCLSLSATLAQTNNPAPDYTPTATQADAPTNSTPPKVRQLTMQDCIQMAIEHNLDLQIARYSPQLALYKLRGDYGAYDPAISMAGQHDYPGFGQDRYNEFTTGFGPGLLPWGTTYNLQGSVEDHYGGYGGSNGNGSASISVTQPLLKNFWIDAARLAIRTDKNNLKSQELQLKQQIMQTATSVEQAYFDLIYNIENVVVQEKAVELAERLVLENKKKLEVGAMAPLDLASAEAQAAQSRAAVIAAKSQLGTQERKLKQLITDQFSQWADIVLQPTVPLTATRQFFNRQDSWSRALTQRPDLLQAKLSLENAGIQLKYSRNQLFPELDVIATYGYNGAGTAYSGALYDIQNQNHPFSTYGGQITIPLGNISARNNYKSSKVSLQQAVLTVKTKERDIMIAIDNDIGTLRADYDQVQATRAQREFEDQALDAEQKKLENGKSTTYTVLQVQRDLTTARGAEIQALDTYNKDLSQLSLDEASTLERLAIDIEPK